MGLAPPLWGVWPWKARKRILSLVKSSLPKLAFVAVLCAFALSASSFAAGPPPDFSAASFSGDGPWMVYAWFGTEEAVREVASWGDHFQRHPKLPYLRLLADAERLDELRRLGFFVELDRPATDLIRGAEEANRRNESLRLAGEPVPAGIPSFPCYRTVEETYASAQAIVTAHPDLATWTDIGDSWEKVTAGGLPGYDLMVLKLTNSAIPGPKPILFVNAAIHAREYTTAELVTRFAEELVAGYGVEADATWLLDSQEIHLLLQTNPDGRKQAEAGVLWRKNTNGNYCGTTSSSRGADLNRNFSFQWNCCGGSSASACSDTYHGPSPASEPEVQALQSYLLSIFPDQRADTYPGGAAPEDATGVYLDIHSFSDLVLWPWGGTPTTTGNDAAFTALGRRFAWFTGYIPEQAIDLYATDGTTIDFAYGNLGVAALTFELGTAFFESCASFEGSVLPANLGALRYAAKVARTPYMTPGGPEARDLALTPLAIPPGSSTTLEVTLDDTKFSNANGAEPVQPISGAEAYVDLAPWQAGSSPLSLVPDDGQWNATVEAAHLEIASVGLATGRHIVFVRGQDASGAWGPISAQFLDILDPATAPFVEGFVREAGTLAPLAATVAVGPYLATTNPATGAYSIQVPAGTYDLRATSVGHATRQFAGVVAAPLATVTEDFLLPATALVLADDGEGANPGWTAASPWALTTETAATPTHAWSDSPGGNYANNRDSSLTSPIFDLTAASDVSLGFWHRCRTEAGWDYCHVEVSANGGSTWTEVARYDGVQADWQEVALPLPQLDGAAAGRLRFRLTSDTNTVEEGWHVDDIVLTAVFPPPATLFADGFESGDSTVWSATAP